MWSAPAPDERAALTAAHAHRFPVPVRVTVRGDGGAPLSLPFLLGNPTGALRVPAGRVSPAFAQVIGAINMGRDEGDDDELIRDCVLYPPPALLAAARNQWPGLVSDLSKQIAAKIGLSSAGAEMFAGEDLPAAVAGLLEAHPRATCRRFTPPGADGRPVDLLLVVDTPSRLAYDAFTEAIAARDADRPKLLREFAEGVTRLQFGATGDAFDQWPGLLCLVVGIAAKLAATVGESRLGEW